MRREVRLGNVMIDCRDKQQLRNFYAELLGWEKCEKYGCPGVISEDGVLFLFIEEKDYLPPVWPEQDKLQQKQMHFDFQVPDVVAAVQQAEAMGARKAPVQFGGDHFVTMFDPAGHPFCLCAEE